jgi:hypothetical protein
MINDAVAIVVFEILNSVEVSCCECFFRTNHSKGVQTSKGTVIYQTSRSDARRRRRKKRRRPHKKIQVERLKLPTSAGRVVECVEGRHFEGILLSNDFNVPNR